MKQKLTVIYTPAAERKYCTIDLGSDYTVVKSITKGPGEITIVYEEDGEDLLETWGNVPFYYEEFVH